MIFKPNFKSIVAIGGFNPAILTPDFLSDFCLFKSEHEPAGRTTPVLSEIWYGNLQFLMELNRFQIYLQEIDNFDNEYPIDIILKYLDVLKYTPLSLIGINFNYSLTEINISHIKQSLKDPFNMEEFWGFVPLSVQFNALKRSNEKLDLHELTMANNLTAEFKISVKLTFNVDSIIINENYEIAGLEKNRDRIRTIPENYGKLLENNTKLIKLFGSC